MNSCSDGIASCSWPPATFVWTPQPWQTWREKFETKMTEMIQRDCISGSRLHYTDLYSLFGLVLAPQGKFAARHGLRSLMSA